MKKFNLLITISLLFILSLILKNNIIIKESVLASINIWVNTIIPSMLPIYLIIDLIINYGTPFKKNYLFLLFNNLLLGSPSNAKYIKEFYLNNKVDLNTSNLLLIISYSPNKRYQCDLWYLPERIKENTHYLYCLDIIDLFSKWMGFSVIL